MSAHGPMPRSSWIFPALAVLLFLIVTATGYGFTLSAGGGLFAVVLLVILFGTVFAAVHHSEVIAERIGEPYGTLLLTLAVTIIEVALITTIMLGDKPAPALARDTVFAVVMIVCNGLVGLCVFIGGLRYREQGFQVSGANVYLSVLIALATLTLIMPNYTLTTPGPIYSTLQLGFVDLVTIVLYGVFLYTQIVLHKDYFVHERADGEGGRGPSVGQDAGAQHRAAADLAAGRRSPRQEVLAGGRRRRRQDRRPAGVCGPPGRAPDPACRRASPRSRPPARTTSRRASIWRSVPRWQPSA